MTPTIHFAGDFTADQVETAWTDVPGPPVPAVQAIIDAAWAQARARLGERLFDGPMLRLNSWHIDGPRLRLSLGHTSYKPFLGTNLMHADLADEYGPDVLANPLGLSAALESADGYLIFGRRNANVAYHPNRIHPFAGSAVQPDVFAELRRELSEELSLQKGDITDIRCIGMAEDPAIRQPELIFRVISTRPRREIEDRLDMAEHEGVWCVRADPKVVETAAEERDLTPIAMATLMLWVRATRCGTLL